MYFILGTGDTPHYNLVLVIFILEGHHVFVPLLLLQLRSLHNMHRVQSLSMCIRLDLAAGLVD